MSYVLVFLAMALLDGLWAAYVQATANDSIIQASTLATAIILTTGFVTVSYVNNRWNLIPAALGAFVGTFIAMMLT